MLESRLAVGSSASTRSGSLANATGDRDPLLLASRELLRQEGEPLLQVQFGQQGDRAAARRRAADTGDVESDFDVLLRRQRGHQVEVLEDEPDPVCPDRRSSRLAKVGDPHAADVDRSRGGAKQAAEHREQCRLAAAGWPDDEDDFALIQGQIDPAHSLDRRLAGSKAPADVPRVQHGGRAPRAAGRAPGGMCCACVCICRSSLLSASPAIMFDTRSLGRLGDAPCRQQGSGGGDQAGRDDGPGEGVLG